MDAKIPAPDALLKKIKQDKRQDGKLKIFFGYAAGVGKTYAMLEAAHRAKESGTDVVAGYIEPHTRPDTLALLDGLERAEPLRIAYKGAAIEEFNLDAAIARRPSLVLVDGLAHTNAPGCRHLKRFQDVQELLRAGIDVYTTVNVQHIESLNDIVASITGATVRERIPDSVFDSADQVELVDIEPSELISRLMKGKIYTPSQAQRALEGFFTRENLVALREIALRRTADRINRVAEKEKPEAPKGNFYTEEHILICLSSSPSNAKVIRTAARMADAFHGTFTALFVETPHIPELSSQNRGRFHANLRLAEQLGAKISTVYGEDVAYQISEYAKASGVSKIVIGRSNNKRSLYPLLLTRNNLSERLAQLAPNIDIYIIPDDPPPYDGIRHWKPERLRLCAADCLKTAGILLVSTVIGSGFSYLGFSDANIITVYILGVLITSIATNGRIYSIVSSLLSVIIFNFLFIEPLFTLHATGAEYPITFLITFIAAFLTGSLTMRVKNQARQMARKAYRTEILLETSQVLQQAESREDIGARLARQLVKLLDMTVLLYLAQDGALSKPQCFPASREDGGKIPPAYTSPSELAAADWVYKNHKHAGATTDTLPGSKCLYMAVCNRNTVFAVVAIAIDGQALETFEKSLMITMLSESALAFEKQQLDETKNEISMRARQEALRANLLRAISHDLRTPLTSISGNAGVLMANSSVLDEDKKQRLYSDIYDDSLWLINLVENLLFVTRIENGSMQLRLQPELISDIIAEALRHINRRSDQYHIKVELEDDLLLARMDSKLIMQVIINIVNNAVQYTPAGSTIVISASHSHRTVCVEIADNGMGLPDEAKERLFEMFYTSDNTRGDGRRGMGLGLSLCRSIIQSHGGTITVRDNVPHGTIFRFTLQEEVLEHEQA